MLCSHPSHSHLCQNLDMSHDRHLSISRPVYHCLVSLRKPTSCNCEPSPLHIYDRGGEIIISIQGTQAACRPLYMVDALIHHTFTCIMQLHTYGTRYSRSRYTSLTVIHSHLASYAWYVHVSIRHIHTRTHAFTPSTTPSVRERMQIYVTEDKVVEVENDTCVPLYLCPLQLQVSNHDDFHTHKGVHERENDACALDFYPLQVCNHSFNFFHMHVSLLERR